MSCFYYEKGVISHDKILFFFFSKEGERDEMFGVCVPPPKYLVRMWWWMRLCWAVHQSQRRPAPSPDGCNSGQWIRVWRRHCGTPSPRSDRRSPLRCRAARGTGPSALSVKTGQFSRHVWQRSVCTELIPTQLDNPITRALTTRSFLTERREINVVTRVKGLEGSCHDKLKRSCFQCNNNWDSPIVVI